MLTLCTAAFFLAASDPSFEAATLKPSDPASSGVHLNLRGPRSVVTRNTSLLALIRFAYDVRDREVFGGPAWLDKERWDLNAVPDRPIMESEEGLALGRAMMKQLLVDRFHLAVHREPREMPVYRLVVTRSGMKAALSNPESKKHNLHGGNGEIGGESMQMDDLAHILTDVLEREVIDRTELAGRYDFKLTFSPPDAADIPDRPSLFTALTEQLGLKLESAREPVPVLVIDSAERPSEN